MLVSRQIASEVRESEMFLALRKLVADHQEDQRWHSAVEAYFLYCYTLFDVFVMFHLNVQTWLVFISIGNEGIRRLYTQPPRLLFLMLLKYEQRQQVTRQFLREFREDDGVQKKPVYNVTCL